MHGGITSGHSAMLAEKLHRKFVECVLFGVPMSVWTEISVGSRLRRDSERDSFRFSIPLSLIVVDRWVWVTNPPCGGLSLGCLLEKNLRNLGNTKVLLLYLLLFCSVYFHYESGAWDQFRSFCCYLRVQWLEGEKL